MGSQSGHWSHTSNTQPSGSLPMSLPITELLSQRGKTLLVYNNYKYNRYRRLSTGYTKWKCVNRKCKAFINTDDELDERTITDSDTNHTHEPLTDNLIQRQSVAAVVKKKAIDDLGEAPYKIIDECVNESHTDLMLEDVRCIRKRMYYYRRKVTTGIPPKKTDKLLEEQLSKSVEDLPKIKEEPKTEHLLKNKDGEPQTEEMINIKIEPQTEENGNSVPISIKIENDQKMSDEEGPYDYSIEKSAKNDTSVGSPQDLSMVEMNGRSGTPLEHVETVMPQEEMTASAAVTPTQQANKMRKTTGGGAIFSPSHLIQSRKKRKRESVGEARPSPVIKREVGMHFMDTGHQDALNVTPGHMDQLLSLSGFDPTDAFFMGVSQTVKRFKPLNQVILKKAIANLIFEVELKETMDCEPSSST